MAAYIELVSGTSHDAFVATKEKISRNTREMFEMALKTGRSPLEAAMDMARERVLVAMKAKGRWGDLQT